MKLTKKAEHALKAVHYCAGLPRGRKGTIGEIAEAESIPREYLSKILRKLTCEGVLIASRGIKGGYLLARRPSHISYLNVIEAVCGPLKVPTFQNPSSNSPKSQRLCEMAQFWKDLERTLQRSLRDQNFSGCVRKHGS